MYYSRVVMGRIDPNKKDEDETLALFMNDIIPAAREQKGFRGANFLYKPENRAIYINNYMEDRRRYDCQ